MTVIYADGNAPVLYPWAIARAISLLDEVSLFKDMPDSYWPVLIRLVKKIDISKPQTEIFAKRETLADESRRSVQTVSRALRWLEDNGLIEKREKICRGENRGSHSPIRFSTPVINTLVYEPENREGEKQPRPPIISGVSVSSKMNSNLKKQSSEPVDNSTDSNVTKAFVSIDGKQIPTELSWLTQGERISATAVLCLMGMAGKAKQRLSSIVAISRAHLEKLKGKSLFAYLKKLISMNKDWGYLDKQQQQESQKQEQEVKDAEMVKNKAIDLIGRVLVGGNGAIYQVEGGGFYRVKFNNQERVGLINCAFIQSINNGRLRVIK